MSATEVNYTEATVTARKPHRCEGFAPRCCDGTIRSGDRYARLVAFPGHDANGGTRPWVMKVCVACFTHDGRLMPPQRKRGRS